MSNPILRIQRLRPDAVVPRYQTAGASGLDLHAVESRSLWPGQGLLLGTGIAIAIPDGYEAQIRGRSSLAAKHGVLATLGTIDADYRGELRVQLINQGPTSYDVKAGDRIAQLVVAPVARVIAVEVEALDETERGEGGFGSTGP